jgi:NDP-sugar pyrophosphorylase family protein
MPRIVVGRLNHHLAGVPAAILAGGLGTRLLPALPGTPKVLAPIQGRPFLAYVLDQLAAESVRQAILLTGFRAEQVARAFGNRYGPCRLDYSPEARPLGTAGALRQALLLFNGATVLLMNGDSYCQVDLAAFHAMHRRRRVDLSMVVVRADDSSRFGRVRFHDNGTIVGFDEKSSGPTPGWINAGIYLIERRLIEEIPPGQAASLERVWLPRWIAARKSGAFPTEGPFLDIGTPDSYQAAARFFANMPHPRGKHALSA